MSRRSAPAKSLDDRTFAVRVRFAIPELGLSCLNDLYAWLQQRAPHNFAIHGAGTQPHCAFLYLNDPALAAECIKTFELNVHGLPKESP